MQRAIRSLPPLQPFKTTLNFFTSSLQYFHMEYQILFSLLFSFLVFMLIILRIGKRSKTEQYLRGNLPPGPKKLPFIGNIHQLLVGSMPHHCLANLAQKYGPIMHLKLGEVSTMVVSSPEAAKEVLHTQGIIFAQRAPLLAASIMVYDSADIVFAPYGDFWRQMRKICTLEVLSAKRVQSFRSIREEEVSGFVYSVSSNAGLTVNLSEKIHALTYRITARAAFGGVFKGQEKFIPVIQEATKLSSGFNFADLFPSIKLLQLLSGVGPKMRKVHREIDRMLEQILNEHRTKRAMEKNGETKGIQDLVDVLLDLQEHGDLEFPLTTDNVKATILDIFAGGSETSSTVVEWAMSEMMRNPEVLRKAQAEVREVFDKKGKVDEDGLNDLKYLKQVVKETLRLHPSVPLSIPRENTEKCQVFGYDVPVKTKVIVNVWAIGRDPKYWKEAERFWPERFSDSSIDYKGTNFELIPFGAGRRMCPGISFATPSIELPLAELLYYFDWKVPNGEEPQDLDMTESFGVTTRRKNDLYLIPISYRVPFHIG